MTEIKKLAELCSKAEGFEKSRYIKNFIQRLEDKGKILDSLKIFYEKYSQYLDEGNFSFLSGDDKVKLIMKDAGNTYLPLSDVYQQFKLEKDEKAIKYVEFYLVGALLNIAGATKLKDIYAKFKQAEKVEVENGSLIEGLTSGVMSLMKEQGEKKMDLENFMLHAARNEKLKNTMCGVLGKVQNDPSQLGAFAAEILKKTQ